MARWSPRARSRACGERGAGAVGDGPRRARWRARSGRRAAAVGSSGSASAESRGSSAARASERRPGSGPPTGPARRTSRSASGSSTPPFAARSRWPSTSRHAAERQEVPRLGEAPRLADPGERLAGLGRGGRGRAGRARRGARPAGPAAAGQGGEDLGPAELGLGAGGHPRVDVPRPAASRQAGRTPGTKGITARVFG